MKSLCYVAACLSLALPVAAQAAGGKKSYLESSMLGLGYFSEKEDNKVGATTTTTETTGTKYATEGSITLKGFWDSGFTSGIALSGPGGLAAINGGNNNGFAPTLRLGFLVDPEMIEVGGMLSINGSSSKTKIGSGESENSLRLLVIGAYGVFTMPLGEMGMEVDADLGMISGSGENKVGSTTTKTLDVSGFLFDLQGRIVVSAAEKLDFLAGAKFGYVSATNKNEGNPTANPVVAASEDTTSGFQLGLTAGLRFKF